MITTRPILHNSRNQVNYIQQLSACQTCWLANSKIDIVNFVHTSTDYYFICPMMNDYDDYNSPLYKNNIKFVMLCM